MRVKFLDLPDQYRRLQSEIDPVIQSVISEASFIGGPIVKAFEASFAKYCGVGHCIGVGNGTDALEIAIESLNLPAGSEILVPANSFVASAEAVTRTGHQVVFVEPSGLSATIDGNDVERAATANTAAVIAVHLYGQPCEMSSISEAADAYGLKVIEDAAQAHGATYLDRRVGSLADVAAFSFYPGKNLGAYGDAGAITTNFSDLAMRARLIANHGRIDKYDHKIEGRNSRLDGLQAAILDVKLRHLDDWLGIRRTIAQVYRSRISQIPGIQLFAERADSLSAYHLFPIITPDRDGIASHLFNYGIATGIHYPTSLPFLSAYDYLEGRGGFLASENRSKCLLSLPIGDHMTENDANYVCDCLAAYFG
ncbi:MAG: DegT/DnrJ/EryC1/StrS family aminotransferase [Cellvibrionaceae bacterium]